MLTLATSPVAPSLKLTSSIGDKSPGHNQKDEERQKCKGDGYDHCCSARQGSLPQPMSRRSKNPCGTKSTFMPWPSSDREMRLERPPESAKGGGFAMLRIREGIGAMAEGRGRPTGAARADDGVGCVPLGPALSH
jgi:hypothetical protein